MTTFSFKTIKPLLIVLSMAFITNLSHAGVAIIVNPGVGIDSITDKDLQRIFLGKTKNFPNGTSAVPVNQNVGEAARDTFNAKVLNKDEAQLKSYWSRLIFTGKGTPPKDEGNDDAVKNLVANNPNTIGYIDSSKVDGSVKSVLTID